MGRPLPPRRRGVVAAPGTYTPAVALALAIVASSCAASGAGPAAEGVGGIPASALVQQGMYLGPPGNSPAGVPVCQAPTPPTTTTGTGTTGSSPPPVSGGNGFEMRIPAVAPAGSEQQAVQGDPANGRATVSSKSAEVTALAEAGGFAETPDAGVPVLVQFEDIYACITATAWAIPLTGMMQLSCGPAPTNGAATPPCTRQPGAAVAFVDAATGKLITEPGFSPGPS